MDLAALIEQLKANGKPKVISFHSLVPEVQAVEQYLNWAIYNSPSGLSFFEEAITASINAYKAVVMADAANNAPPPETF